MWKNEWRDRYGLKAPTAAELLDLRARVAEHRWSRSLVKQEKPVALVVTAKQIKRERGLAKQAACEAKAARRKAWRKARHERKFGKQEQI